MWASSIVATGSVAVMAQHTEPIRVSVSYQPEICGKAAAHSLGAPVDIAASVRVVDAQKLNETFLATCASGRITTVVLEDDHPYTETSFFAALPKDWQESIMVFCCGCSPYLLPSFWVGLPPFLALLILTLTIGGIPRSQIGVPAVAAVSVESVASSFLPTEGLNGLLNKAPGAPLHLQSLYRLKKVAAAADNDATALAANVVIGNVFYK